MRDVIEGQLVKPALHHYLMDAEFPDFSVHFRKAETGPRKPDGWFHPSSHPLMDERVLYEYLANPETFPAEHMQYMNTLSVTMGRITHEFIQMCLTDMGLRPAHLQVCEMCSPESGCREAGVKDEELGERGHLDGLLDLTSLGPHVSEALRMPTFEFKTSNDNFGKLSKIDDLDLEAFKKKWPGYYAQQQRYQKMSGRRMTVVLMMEMSYPWVMREFHVPFDPAFNAGIDQKYRRIRQHVADQQPPECCGKYKSCAIGKTRRCLPQIPPRR